MSNKIQNIPLEKIVKNRFQPEGVRNVTTIMEIAASLLQNKDNGTKGLLQVPTARKNDDGMYELAFGHHRFEAFLHLWEGQDDLFFMEMPLIVRELTDIEMFELMAIENFHRRDIGAIEEANTLHSYMTNFKKTSAEAAKKFEKTEEYVRGSIRLLNLPDAALKMVEEGKLNKSAARDLLVAEKLCGSALVQEILDEIEIEAERNKNIPPSETIEEVLRMSAKTQLIDMQSPCFTEKKFPVKYLAKLTAQDIHDLIEFDMTGHDLLIDDVIKELLVLISAGMEITDAAFPMITPESLERLRVLANPPQCEKCPLHAVMNGTHFCGLPQCKSRKVDAWKEKSLADEIKKIGIPLYQKSDGAMASMDAENDADRKLFAKGSPDLRLLPAQFVWNNFEGVSTHFKVVLVGETAKKRLSKKEAEVKDVKREQDQQQKGASNYESRQIKENMLIRFEWEVVSLAFECLMDGITSFPFLLHSVEHEWNGARFPDDVDEELLIKQANTVKKADGLKTLRRMAMFHMIEQAHDVKGNWQHLLHSEKSILDYADDWKQIATEWGIALPKDFAGQAEQYQAELDKALAGDLAPNDLELVSHLINTSVDDMRSSLGCNKYAKKVLQEAFKSTTERGEKTKAKILQAEIKKVAA